MKKWIIISILIIFAGIIFQKYAHKEDNRNKPVVYNVEKSTASENTGINLPHDEEPGKVCNKNVENILADYNKKWTDEPRKYNNSMIDIAEAEHIKDLVVSYKLCQALSQKNRDICNTLPGGRNKPGDIDAMRQLCYARYDDFILISSIINKTLDEGICKSYMDSHKFGNDLTTRQFCSAISDGFPNFCSNLEKIYKDKNKLIKKCYPAFPKKIEDVKDIETKKIYLLEKALLNVNPESCPDSYKPMCLKYLSKDFSCDTLEKKISGEYCNLYNKNEERIKEENEKLKQDLEKVKLEDAMRKKEIEEGKKIEEERKKQEEASKIRRKMEIDQEKRDAELKKIREKMKKGEKDEGKK
jgi:hypothetical protein